MQAKPKLYLLVTVLGLLVAALPAVGAEANLDLVVHSHYVWRGQVLHDDAVFQPSLTVESPYGLKFNTWANMNLRDNGLKRDFSEADLTLAYTHEVGERISLEAGVVQYVLKTASNTREIYATVGLNVPLSPTLSVFYDFDEVDDLYVQAGSSHSLALAEKLTLDLGATVGFGGKDYNDYYFSYQPPVCKTGEAISADRAAFNDATLSAGLTYAFSETLSLAVNVYYTALLDSDIRDAAQATFGDKNKMYGGVTLTRSF